MLETAALFLPDWAVRLVTQLGTYLALFAAGGTFVSWAKRRNDKATARGQFVQRFCFGAVVDKRKKDDGEDKDKTLVTKPTGLTYLVCIAGLLGSYLTWGVLQEKIMGQEYSTGRLESSNLLVFCNRFVAFGVAGVILQFFSSGDQPLKAPLYEFSYVSLSNILSSWCQLEALKFVSFPTQVLAKSSKLVPVMLVGMVLLQKRYKAYEFACAILIGVGASIFMLSQSAANNNNNHSSKETSASGLVLMILYLGFDSFTSQWQGHLFKTYGMSSYQMMFGINMFSSFFTLVSLVQSGELASSLFFVLQNPECMRDIAGFSLAGICGQMFIFYTIKTLGPLIFTMIMTSRQVLSIIISCIVFSHVIPMTGVLGASIVFGAVGYQIYVKTQK